MGFKCAILSMIHHLHIALCAQHPKSKLLSPYTQPPLPFTIPSTPLPSGNCHTAACVFEFLFFCLVCSFVAFSYKTHISHMSSRLFLLKLFCLAWYSQDPSMAVFYLFLGLSSIPLYKCTTFSLPGHVSRDTSVVSMSWSLWECCSEHRDACIFWNKCFLILGVGTQKRGWWVIW